jgi:hypothetical protein
MMAARLSNPLPEFLGDIADLQAMPLLTQELPLVDVLPFGALPDPPINQVTASAAEQHARRSIFREREEPSGHLQRVTEPARPIVQLAAPLFSFRRPGGVTAEPQLSSGKSHRNRLSSVPGPLVSQCGIGDACLPEEESLKSGLPNPPGYVLPPSTAEPASEPLHQTTGERAKIRQRPASTIVGAVATELMALLTDTRSAAPVTSSAGLQSPAPPLVPSIGLPWTKAIEPDPFQPSNPQPAHVTPLNQATRPRAKSHEAPAAEILDILTRELLALLSEGRSSPLVASPRLTPDSVPASGVVPAAISILDNLQNAEVVEKKDIHDEAFTPAGALASSTWPEAAAFVAPSSRTELDAETLASMVNEILSEQARRHGVDLS